MSLWCLIRMTTWWRLRRSGRACTLWSRVCGFEAAWLFSLRLVIHAFLNKSLNEKQIIRLIFRPNCCIAEQLDGNNLCLKNPVIISTIFPSIQTRNFKLIRNFPSQPICSKYLLTNNSTNLQQILSSWSIFLAIKGTSTNYFSQCLSTNNNFDDCVPFATDCAYINL